MPEIVMPQCDDEQLQISKNEQEKRGKVFAQVVNVGKHAGYFDRAGEVWTAEVSRDTDTAEAIGAVVKDTR